MIWNHFHKILKVAIWKYFELTRQTIKEIAQNYVGSLHMIGALVNELRFVARATNFFVLAVTIIQILWVHAPPRQGKERGNRGGERN